MDALTILTGATLVLLAYVFSLRARVRLADERCARVLETAAAAVRRGLPVDPLLFWHAAHEHRGWAHHRLRAVARGLDMGEPLAEALGRPLRLAGHERAMLEAADGTPAVAAALERAARTTSERLDVGHRFAAAMVYPAVVLVGVVFVFQILRKFDEIFESMEIERAYSWQVACDAASYVIVVTALVLVVGAIVEMTGRHMPFLSGPARMLRTAYATLPGVRRVFANADAARFLDVVAFRLDAGDDLSKSMANAGRAADGSRVGRSAQRVSHALASGGDPGTAWRALPLPPGVSERAALLSVGPHAAAHLRVLASRCVERARSGADALVRAFPAAAALAVGALLTLILLMFFSAQGTLLESVQ